MSIGKRARAMGLCLVALMGMGASANATLTVENATSPTTSTNWTASSYGPAWDHDMFYATGPDSNGFVDGTYTKSGLPLDTYNVYIYYFYFGATYAKLTGGSFQNFGYTGIPGTSWNPTIDTNYRFAYVGTVTDTNFSVIFHHDGPGGIDSYVDAFGFEAVPEPASAALVVVGGVLALGRRRGVR